MRLFAFSISRVIFALEGLLLVISGTRNVPWKNPETVNKRASGGTLKAWALFVEINARIRLFEVKGALRKDSESISIVYKLLDIMKNIIEIKNINLIVNSLLKFIICLP